MLRIPVVPCLLVLCPLILPAQARPAVTLNVGAATAYGGGGPSGSVRLELPLHHTSDGVTLVWGLTGWLAQTHVAGSRYEIKRNIKGVGPWLGAQWRPGGSGWRVTVGGGLQYVRNDNQDPLVIPCQEDCGGPIPDDSRHGADWAGHGGAIHARLTLPARMGPRFEVGVAAIRHALLDQAAWWTRVEVGLRLGGD